MVGRWNFTSLQHPQSYEDGYRLVTVSTYGSFIMLPHWDQAAGTMTRYSIQSHYPDTELTSLCSIVIMQSQARKRQVSIL